MLLKRSGVERVKMGCSMHATAQTLVRASILQADPAASPAALRKALFLRFYGQDFDARREQDPPGVGDKMTSDVAPLSYKDRQ